MKKVIPIKNDHLEKDLLEKIFLEKDLPENADFLLEGIFPHQIPQEGIFPHHFPQEGVFPHQSHKEGIPGQPHQCGIIWRLPNQDVAHVAIQTFISWKIVKHF
jgi:hypothetical protein